VMALPSAVDALGEVVVLLDLCERVARTADDGVSTASGPLQACPLAHHAREDREGDGSSLAACGLDVRDVLGVGERSPDLTLLALYRLIFDELEADGTGNDPSILQDLGVVAFLEQADNACHAGSRDDDLSHFRPTRNRCS